MKLLKRQKAAESTTFGRHGSMELITSHSGSRDQKLSIDTLRVRSEGGGGGVEGDIY